MRLNHTTTLNGVNQDPIKFVRWDILDVPSEYGYMRYFMSVIGLWAMKYAASGHLKWVARCANFILRFPSSEQQQLVREVFEIIARQDVEGELQHRYAMLYYEHDEDVTSQEEGQRLEAEFLLSYLEFGIVRLGATLDLLRTLTAVHPAFKTAEWAWVLTEVEKQEADLLRKVHVYQRDESDPDREPDDERLGAIYMAFSTDCNETDPNIVPELIKRLRSYQQLPSVGQAIIAIDDKVVSEDRSMYDLLRECGVL